MKITPAWTATFETNLQTLVVDAWQRMATHLIWDKFVDVRQSTTLKELYFYLIESAGITDQGQGGNKRFDDIAATFFEIDNADSGAGLRLTKNEIEDNMMAGAGLKGMPALDYAANWAKQMGGAAGYQPQQKFFDLLAAGKTNLAYDAVAFFSKSHPTNVQSGTATYANLLAGAAASTPATDPLDALYPGACPIDLTNASTLEIAAENFAKAVAYIRAIKQPNGKPRNLVVKYLLHSVFDQFRANQLLDTKYFGTGAGATENVLTKYGIEPVCASELTEAGVYYLACEMLPGEGGPIIWQNREAYVLSSYQPATQAELQRKKVFEWDFDGRNAAGYGHPYLLFRVEPT